MTLRGSVLYRAARRAALAAGALIALGCTPAEEIADLPPAPAPAARDVAPNPMAALAPSATPEIVSLSPLATLFLTQLGVGDRIIATDRETRAEDGSAKGRHADLDSLIRLEPDLVFLEALPDDRAELVALESTGARVIEFAPHDLEDLLAYCHGIGVELAGEAAVEAFERRVLRPVALVAGESSPTGRLRTVAVVGVDPPEIAGGHSFETDLIEIAGATSLTHGADDNRRPIDREALARMRPDLVLVMTEHALGPADQDRAFALVGTIAPVVFFPFARETFWLEEPVREARRLREVIVDVERGRRSAERP
jgi:ABC-type Fe3+-hydroxamate transport system substrate-binding protein